MGLFDRFKSGTTPKTPEEWTNKGLELLRSGLDQEATQCFDKALAIDPQYPMALRLSSCTWVPSPGTAHQWSEKGARLVQAGCNERARQCYDKALSIDPQDSYARSLKQAGYR